MSDLVVFVCGRVAGALGFVTEPREKSKDRVFQADAERHHTPCLPNLDDKADAGAEQNEPAGLLHTNSKSDGIGNQCGSGDKPRR